MTIGEVMDFLGKYTKTGVPVSDLSRFSALMDILGNPQDRLNFIHIAGTNGKGSAAEMTAETFSRAGYVTGEFTSPFIYRYNDRIKIGGEEISDRELCETAETVIPAVKFTGETGYSQFEITAAIAFVYYLNKKCDIVVLETGLGGLLDCTNIIKTNVCSVITSISFDHTAVLGNTLSEIAFHKAGIIKEKSPCFLECNNPPEAVSVIKKTAENLHSEVIIPEMNEIVTLSSDLSGNTFKYKNVFLKTKMAGVHQIYNAVTAYEALIYAKYHGYDKISAQNIIDGIYNARVPSRCEIISDDPTVILDGAHNPDGMKRLSELVNSTDLYPKIMVCGMLRGKDVRSAISHISPLVAKAYCTDGFYPSAYPADKLTELFKNAESVRLEEAVTKAKKSAGKNGLVIIAGSLYLASALKNKNLI